MGSRDLVAESVGRSGWLQRSNVRIGLILAVACGLCGCLAWWIMPWDQRLAVAAGSLSFPGDLRKTIELSEAFAHGSGCTVILAALLITAVDRRRAVLLAILMTITSGLAANGLKAAFVRQRPYAVAASATALESDLATQYPTRQAGRTESSIAAIDFLGPGSFWEESERSFPSGHTATAWGLAIGLSVIFPRLTLLAFFLAALASFQRLHSGAHYPSDIFAGAAIAFFCCAAIMTWPGTGRFLQEKPR